MSDSLKRERFGRYLILDHLVNGGMAKICRARFLGEQADKLVAIKMIQPQYSKDEAFKSMFMDEIKVTFGLIHPNIIQTYDYGFHKGQLFVAMEYCDGRNLKEYLGKLRDRKFVFPIEISTYIISQACQGLFYAHTFRDKLTGQESNIIHRDISPHNIMLTYDGVVKIIDFGIAKSQTNSEATIAGTIKGKLAYLAPEYLEGMDLDARYDQFALGNTLWEMLCSKKLFKENNDLAILRKIQECKIPAPSSINPNVPKELDEIVLKALSKDRNNRFENLDQMNRALMKFLYAKFPDFNATDLSYFSQELFRDEIKSDREKMFEFGKVDIRPFLDDLKKELEGGTKDGSSESSNLDNLVAKPKEKVLDFGFDGESGTKTKQTNTVKKKSPHLLSEVKENLNSQDIKKESERVRALGQKSISTKLSVDRDDMTRSRVMKMPLRDSASHKKNNSVKYGPLLVVLFIGALAYYYFKNNNILDKNFEISKKSKDRQPAQSNEIIKENLKRSDKLGNIVLSHFDKQKMQVFVNGNKVEVDLLSNVKVPLKVEFTLRVQIEGRKHFIKQMRVDNFSAVEIEIPEMPMAAYGYINTSTSCAYGELRFDVYGEKRFSTIPMSETFGIGLPLEIDEKGQVAKTIYRLSFKKRGENLEKKIEVEILREEQTIDLCDFL